MKRHLRVVTVLIVLSLIFNFPLSVLASLQKSALENCNAENCSEIGLIPNNAILLRGQNALNFIETTNRANLSNITQTVSKSQNREELFSVIIFKTIEERDSFVNEINLIISDSIKPDQMNSIRLTKSDFAVYETQNYNTLYSPDINDLTSTNEDEITVYTLRTETEYCRTCQVFKIVLSVGAFIGALRNIGWGAGWVTNITVNVITTLICNHVVPSSYETQTQCPYTQWCMGTPYLIYDFGGYASFACTCGAQWNFSYN